MFALLRWVVVGIVLAMNPHITVAGGGPETTLVVVNADSPLSMRVANAYAAIRDIPQSNLVWLHDVPSLGTISVETYRKQIWGPIRDYLSEHGLEDQIDTIAYSSDFPYAVNVKADIKANKLPRHRYRGTIASLTGLTFFARRVEIGDAGYFNLYANLYYRRNLAPAIAQPTLTEDQQQLADDAARAFKVKKYDEAVKLYRKLTETGTARAWYELARSLAASGQTTGAMAALQQAVEAGWPDSMLVRRDNFLKSLSVLPEYSALLARMEARNGPFEPAYGFRSRYFWDRWTLPNPSNSATSLNRYYLSTLLAYTGLNGNNIPEILTYLESAAASDGSLPDGTVYLMVNGDIRSQARQRYFPATIRALEKRNRRAEMLTRGVRGQDGIIPIGKQDVIGAVVGTRRFNWPKSGSTLLPGAIAESLTSYGGHFNSRKQTKLTEFLRRGAAGSSGAVAEPYSIQEKFPVAMLHSYYAEGSSLAESFYQSISGPYQLIIVGDPLARPFARFATVELLGPSPSLPWRGTVAIRPEVTAARDRRIDRVELWVDGVQVADAPVGQSITWDTRSADDGSHEIRLVAIEAGAIKTRSYKKFQISIANTGNRIQIRDPEVETRLGDPIELDGEAPNAIRVEAMRGFRVLETRLVVNGAWNLAVPSEMIGIGKASIYVRAAYPDGSIVRSRPITLQVLEPLRIKAGYIDENTSEGLSGILVTRDGLKQDVVLKALGGPLDVLAKDQRDQAQSLRLEGAFQIRASGFYQFVISSRGRFRIKINNRDFGERTVESTDKEIFLPLSLEAGWHSLSIELFPEGAIYLKIVVAGDQVAEVLANDLLRHHSAEKFEPEQAAETVEAPPKPAQKPCEKSGPLQASKKILETKRNSLLIKYTAKHPDIVELEKKIGLLQNKIQRLEDTEPSCDVKKSRINP